MYLKITATDKTSTLVSENNNVVLTLSAPATDNVEFGKVVSPAKITGVGYGANALAAVTAYNGSNTHYEFGFMTDQGILRVIYSN